MDLDKFKIWQTGLTDEERETIAEQESAEKVFKREKDLVSATIRTKGWKFIIDKEKADQNVTMFKLLKCKKKDLERLQLEIKIRKEFLDKWTPYM